MISFTKRYINIISLFISIIVFCFLNNHLFNNQNFETNFMPISSKIQEITSNIEKEEIIAKEDNQQYKNQETIEEIEYEEKQKENKVVQQNEEEKNSEQQVQQSIWQLEIPAINLKAHIAEGTSQEIMNEFVGHFEETVKEDGNIGLAAHNRGYPVNYFQDLKKLKEGDEIIYKYREFEKRYVIKTLKIISDEDWSLLENTENNRITLVTCVENEPSYRRVVQGEEII